MDNLNSRQLARQMAMQALYSWHVSGNPLVEVKQHLFEQEEGKKIDIAYFHKLLDEIPKMISTIDQQIAKHIPRSLSSINPVELAILRIGVYEIQSNVIPYRVAINEGIELAKNFGADQGHKFVNGVLDKIAKEHQPRTP